MKERDIIAILTDLTLSGNYIINQNGLLVQDYKYKAYLITGFRLQGQVISRI
jgi:hypothetical protein